MAIVWFAGLIRGSIAFALIQNLPTTGIQFVNFINFIY